MADILIAILLVLGSAVMLLAGVGVVRMPDLFSRMQAATKASSLGVGCMVLAGAVYFGNLGAAARAILVIAFIFLTAPVAAHLIARAAYAIGTPLWEGTLTDELRDRQREAAQAAPDSPAESPMLPVGDGYTTDADLGG